MWYTTLVCVPFLCLFFLSAYCITVCLHTHSQDPAVYAWVFAVLPSCLPLFVRMNTNWAAFLMARFAIVSKIFIPSLPILWSVNTDMSQLLAEVWCYPCPLTQPIVILLCVTSNIVTPSVFLWPSVQAIVWALLAYCLEQSTSCAFLLFCMCHATCFCFLWPLNFALSSFAAIGVASLSLNRLSSLFAGTRKCFTRAKPVPVWLVFFPALRNKRWEGNPWVKNTKNSQQEDTCPPFLGFC